MVLRADNYFEIRCLNRDIVHDAPALRTTFGGWGPRI